MGLGDYIKARRLGEASYKEHLEEGSYPYLQILDEILNHVTIVSETILKEKEIPVERIRGTYAAGRRTAFAPNFMPLLEDTTEFGEKWSFLFDSLKKEGIREPVKCYEYMNHYYIIEGNKRVSVMKYLGAETIPARVTRLVPRFEPTRACISYYEFLQFYKVCPQNYMIFSEPGAYQKFLFRAWKRPEDEWTDEEMADLKSSYYRFKIAYRQVNPNWEDVNIADVFMAYLNVYPYSEILEKSTDQLVSELRAMKEELTLHESGKNVKLLLSEDETQRHGIFSFLQSSGTGNKLLRIAFIHDMDVNSSEWIYEHELGKNHLENIYGNKVSIRSFYNVNPFQDIYDILAKLGEEKYDIVFTTSRLFLDATLAIAVRFPETRYLCCALNSPHRYVRAYFTRGYEVSYLLGLIAGALTDNDKIGHLINIPSSEALSTLNAFALGVQMIRPSARVYAQWTTLEDGNPDAFFEENDIHLICGSCLPTLSGDTRKYGLYKIEYDGEGEEEENTTSGEDLENKNLNHKNYKIKNIAVAMNDWGIVYEKIVESIRSGAYDDATSASDSTNALNYWWGISTNAVDVYYTKDLPPQTAKMVEYYKNICRDGIFPIFSGKINSLNGPITTEMTDYLVPDDIIHMRWFLDNIICEFPDINKLTDQARVLMLAYIQQ